MTKDGWELVGRMVHDAHRARPTATFAPDKGRVSRDTPEKRAEMLETPYERTKKQVTLPTAGVAPKTPAPGAAQEAREGTPTPRGQAFPTAGIIFGLGFLAIGAGLMVNSR